MDTITQAALGACIAEAGFRDKLGLKATLVGAVCGIIPDLDILLSIGRGDFDFLVTHRGWSHSLVVLPFIAIPVAWLAWTWWKRKLDPDGDNNGDENNGESGDGRPGDLQPDSLKAYLTWYHLCFWALITHPLLDTCTTYGTQLLAPFSRTRFAIDSVSIIDPMYTVPLIVVVVIGLRTKWRPARHWIYATAALILTTGYLLLGLAFSWDAENQAVDELNAMGFEPVDLRAEPTFFQNLVWRVVARDKEGNFAVGIFGTLARNDIQFTLLESDHGPLVDKALDSEAGQIFEWFSTGMLWTQVEPDEGGHKVTLTDMRYGLITKPTRSPFAAVFQFDQNDQLVKAWRKERETDDLDVGEELRMMWAYITGNIRESEATAISLPLAR